MTAADLRSIPMAADISSTAFVASSNWSPLMFLNPSKTAFRLDYQILVNVG